jgi:hypothetical protein
MGRRWESMLTLGAGKETEEARRRVGKGRDEVATGPETMERVAISAVLSPTEGVCALLPRTFLSRMDRTKVGADKVHLRAAPVLGLNLVSGLLRPNCCWALALVDLSARLLSTFPGK